MESKKRLDIMSLKELESMHRSWMSARAMAIAVWMSQPWMLNLIKRSKWPDGFFSFEMEMKRREANKSSMKWKVWRKPGSSNKFKYVPLATSVFDSDAIRSAMSWHVPSNPNADQLFKDFCVAKYPRTNAKRSWSSLTPEQRLVAIALEPSCIEFLPNLTDAEAYVAMARKPSAVVKSKHFGYISESAQMAALRMYNDSTYITQTDSSDTDSWDNE